MMPRKRERMGRMAIREQNVLSRKGMHRFRFAFQAPKPFPIRSPISSMTSPLHLLPDVVAYMVQGLHGLPLSLHLRPRD
jgi:hypothetical protein